MDKIHRSRYSNKQSQSQLNFNKDSRKNYVSPSQKSMKSSFQYSFASGISSKQESVIQKLNTPEKKLCEIVRFENSGSPKEYPAIWTESSNYKQSNDLNGSNQQFLMNLNSNPQLPFSTQNYEDLQLEVNFIDYPEYDTILDNQVLLTITQPNLIKFEQYPGEVDNFLRCIQDIKETVKLVYPFIEVQIKEENLITLENLEIQICSNIQESVVKRVIFSKKYFKRFPSTSEIIQNIRKSLQTIDIKIELSSIVKNMKILGEENKHFELGNIKAVLRQKCSSQQQENLNNSKMSKNSFNESQFRTNKYLSNNGQGPQNVRLYLSPTKSYIDSFHTSFMKTNNSCFSRKSSRQRNQSRENSYDFGCGVRDSSKDTNQNQSIQSVGAKQFQSKLFQQKVYSTNEGVIKFTDIVKEIQFYELLIWGNEDFQSVKRVLDLKELLNPLEHANSPVYELLIPIQLELNDQNLTRVKFEIVHNQKELQDAVLRISDRDFTKQIANSGQEDNSFNARLNFAQYNDFFIRPGSYFYEITRERYVNVASFIHFKKGVTKQRIEMSPIVLPKISVSVKEILNKKALGNCQIEVKNKEGEIVCKGVTSKDGIFKHNLQWHSLIKVCLEKTDYLNQNFEFELNNSHCAKDISFEINMIPKNIKENQLQFLQEFKNSFLARNTSSLLDSLLFENDKNYDEIFLTNHLNQLISFPLHQQFKSKKKNHSRITSGLNSFLKDNSKSQCPSSFSSINPLQQSCTSFVQKDPLNEIAINTCSIQWIKKIIPEFIRTYTQPNNSFSKALQNHNKNKPENIPNQANLNSQYYINEKLKLNENKGNLRVYLLNDNIVLDIITVSKENFIKQRFVERTQSDVEIIQQDLELVIRLNGNGDNIFQKTQNQNQTVNNMNEKSGQKTKNKENQVITMKTEMLDSSSAKKIFVNSASKMQSFNQVNVQQHQRQVSMFQ